MSDNGPANTPFVPPFSVWTQTDNAEWLARNASNPLVLLAAMLPEGSARSLAARLTDPAVYADDKVEIWDSHNRIVWAVNPSLIGTSGNWKDRDGNADTSDT